MRQEELAQAFRNELAILQRQIWMVLAKFAEETLRQDELANVRLAPKREQMVPYRCRDHRETNTI